jgi:exosome complex RNA-binding protein Csl4
MFAGAHKTHKMVSVLTFQYKTTRKGDEFFGHITRVTDDEIRISFVNVRTKEAIETRDADTFTKQIEQV